MSRLCNLFSRAVGGTVLLSLSMLAVNGQPTGSITGRVIAEGAKTAVASAKVYLHSSTTIFRANTTANAAGVYRFDGLPDGRYEVCATPVGSDYVDSCLWNRMGNSVTVSSATRGATVDIAVQKAAKLQLQFTDAQSVLDSVAARAQPVMVHVWSDSFAGMPMAVQTTSKTTRSYEINVPVDVDVSIGIQGPPLRLSFDTTTYSTTDKRVHRLRVDSAKETGKTIPVSVLGLAP